MSVDLTKLVFHSSYNSFKNDNVYTGTLTLSGAISTGTNTRTFDIELPEEPGFLDIIFNGPSEASNPRPDDGWFKQGAAVYTDIDVLGSPDVANWFLTTSISGTTVTVTATYTKTFTDAATMTSTDFSYRIVDYSVL